MSTRSSPGTGGQSISPGGSRQSGVEAEKS
jgi:hypothetical protein